MFPSPGEITLLLSDLQEGKLEAGDKLMPLVYQHLRQMAARHFRHERPGHTLQPTAVVHEAYLRLIKPGQRRWKNCAHFYSIASEAMHRILVEHARAQLAQKRGGRPEKLELQEALVYKPERSRELLALDEVLGRLKILDERQSKIVELRYFGGLTVKETAEVLHVGVTTVKEEWKVAKAWLQRELSTVPIDFPPMEDA